MGDHSLDSLVEETVTVAAAPEIVWEAIVSATQRSQWWCASRLDPELGGRFEEHRTDDTGDRVLISGEVVEFDPPHVLALNWSDEDWDANTRLEFRLTAADDHTEVQLRHTGWHDLTHGLRLAAEYRVGWQRHLRNLRLHVESEMVD